MTVLFRIELRKPDKNPTWIANIKAVEAELIGYYANGKPWKVDKDAVLDVLPCKYKKAYKRSSQFWYDEHRNAHCELDDLRGKLLVSIIAVPYEI